MEKEIVLPIGNQLTWDEIIILELAWKEFNDKFGGVPWDEM